tara:strand:- start:10024 stop:10407 length:384 start_codon:yes stop_codon:yes gene_type:complete
MKNELVIFHFVLAATLTSAFFLQKSITQTDHLLDLYLINAFAAILVYNLAVFFRKTQKDHLGYFFLSGTALKFLIFFVYVLPIFKEDGNQTKEEFFSFFVPYAVALIVETTSLVLLLKHGDANNVKN